MTEGGFLFLGVPAHSASYSFADINAGHFRRYEKSDICNKLMDAGFSVEEFFSVGFPVCNLYTWVFTAYLNLFKHNKVINEERTLSSGIREHKSYYPWFLRVLSKILFPVLTQLIKVDYFFLKTDLGNHYLILARKEKSV